VDLAEQCGLRIDAAGHRTQPGARLLSCLEFDQVIGFLSARSLLEEVEIFDLCVADTHRRRGIGTALLRRLFELVSPEGVEEAFLEVRESNHVARSLYTHLGFAQVGRRARYYPNGEDALLFRCCLTSTG
jgi:ribosomal-protein-alanine N-acetyltransferase